MTLDEAIREMLRGVVMVDTQGTPHKAELFRDWSYVFAWRPGWSTAIGFKEYGWRPATPEELKEIEST